MMLPPLVFPGWGFFVIVKIAEFLQTLSQFSLFYHEQTKANYAYQFN